MMSNDIDWRAIGAQLCAPFDPADVDFRVQGRVNEQTGKGQVVAYIDARSVQERLDETVGPGNWTFEWEPVVVDKGDVQVAKGTLAVHGVSKSDVGAASNFEATLGAVSHCFKRAAVHWGIGRYLYDIPSIWAQVEKGGRISDETLRNLRANLPKPTAQHAPHSTPRGNPTAQTKHATPTPSATPAASQAQATTPPAPDPRTIVSSATEQQLISIRTLCNVLGRNTPTEPMTYAEARQLIGRLNEAYRIARQERATR